MEKITERLNDIGNEDFVNGFIAGYWGREQESENADYENGYGRGYATAERQTAMNENRDKVMNYG
jgi:hypothetical protein